MNHREYIQRFYTATPEDRAYMQLAQKEGVQALLQRMVRERQQQSQDTEMPKIAKAISLRDIPVAHRGQHIAAVTKAYPGLPLKEALKRFGEKSLLPAKAVAAPMPKPSVPTYPEIKAPKFPAMKFAEDETSRAGSAATGVGGLGLAALLAKPGLERVVGAQRFLHGTSTQATPAILEEGLLRSHGARAGGAAKGIAEPRVLEHSKNRVHVADDSIGGRAIAKAHGNMAQAVSDHPGGSRIAIENAYHSPGNKGQILGGVMPFRDFKQHFEVDPDTLTPGAFRTATTDVAPELLRKGRAGIPDILRGRDKDLLGYLKAHPGRAATGAGLLAAGGAGAYYGGQHLREAVMGKEALDLQFNSQEQAQQHNRNRNLAGAAGGVLGAGLGGMVAGKRFGLPGAIAGGVAGSLLGGAPGKLMADVAHDIPQRTSAMYNKSMTRMNAAGGEGIRLAMDMFPAAAPSVSEFLEFAEADHSVDEDDLVVSGYEEDMLKRLKPMGLGADAGLEGGDTGQRNEQMGLPAYNGV